MPENTLMLSSSCRQLISLKICSQTKVLNTMVFVVTLPQPKLGPAKLRRIIMVNWSTAWLKIDFHMLKEINEDPFGSGFLFSNSTPGGSVARAKAANVSCSKLIQSNCIGVNADASSLLA